MALDLIVRNGEVIDGTGAPARRGDVAVAGGRIVEVGRVAGDARVEIDAAGLCVTPGFIDIHSHSDYTLLVDPRAVSQVAQGVTLEVLGNCGFGCAPVRDAALAAASIYGYDGSVPLAWRDVDGYLQRLAATRPALNVLTLVPNGQLRRAILGVADRPADPDELARMERLLEEGLEQGAFGYSTGLEYPAESGAPEEEVTALCRVVARRGALYATHTRWRDEGAVEAIQEALRTARAADVRMQISHLLPRKTDQGELDRSLESVERARASGVDVAFDMHTRLFGTTYLSTILPPWALAGGREALGAHLASREDRERMRAYRSIVAGGGWDRVVLLDHPRFPQWSRRAFGELGCELGRDPHDLAFDILARDLDDLQRAMVLIRAYTPDDQARVFAHPLCMPGSDATALAPDGPLGSATFHGAYSWAAWYFRFMVRERRVLSAEEAVHRMTGLPAGVLGLADRGALRPGARADIAIFDREGFAERATTFEPNQPAVGMRHVVVNGVPVLRDGRLTGERGGEVLRRGALHRH